MDSLDIKQLSLIRKNDPMIEFIQGWVSLHGQLIVDDKPISLVLKDIGK